MLAAGNRKPLFIRSPAKSLHRDPNHRTGFGVQNQVFGLYVADDVISIAEVSVFCFGGFFSHFVTP